MGSSVAALVAASLIVAAEPPDYRAARELRALVDAALANNPALSVSRARIEAARQRAPQAEALPDPVVSVTQALRSVETRVGPQQNAISLSQSFPWFGTRDARRRVAVLEVTALRHAYEAARRDVVRDVKEAWYEIAYLDATLGLAAEERSLLEHYESLARARYSTGQGLQQAVIRLQAEISAVVDRRHRIERQRGILAARLNALADRPAGEPAPPAPRLSRPSLELDPERLRRLGETHRAELRAASARIEGGRRSVDLARLDSRPGFTASLGVMNVARREDALAPPDAGKNALTLSVGVSLPFWNAGRRARIEEASHELMAHNEGRAAVLNAMDRDIEEASVLLETLGRQLDLLDNVLIPQTEEALRATELAYGTGELGVLELLESERALIGVRTMRARYLSDFHIALTALERAIGTRVPGVGDAP